MSPITDDIVFSLLEACERRQKTRAAATRGGTARILDFTLRDRLPTAGRIISLDVARARRRVSGMFCYAARC